MPGPGRRVNRRSLPLALFAACLLLAGAGSAQDAPGASEADMQLEFAERLFQLHSYRTAAPEFRKFLTEYENDPRREEVRYKLAICYVSMGENEENYKKALAELVTLRKEFPNGKRLQDCLFRSGHIRYLLGDRKGAIDDLSDLLEQEKVEPGLSVRAHHFLGRARYDLGQNEPAVTHLSHVVRAPKENPLRRFALIILANAHLKLKQFDKAADVLGTLFADYPKLAADEELRLKLADARLAVEQYDEALAAYKALDARGAHGYRAALGKARACLGLDKRAEAMKTARALLTSYRETPETKGLQVREQCFYILGVVHFERDEWSEAAAAFEKLLDAVKQGRMAEDAAYKLCWCYYRLGKKQAKKLVASCVSFRRLFPTSKWTGQVVFLAAEGYRMLGDYANAVTYYKQVDPKDANHPDALYRIAHCYHKDNKPEEAARAYDAFVAAAEEHKRTNDALADAAGLYQSLGKYEEAAARYRRFIERTAKGSEQAEAMYQLGVCYAKLSQFSKMADVFSRCAAAYPKSEHTGAAYYWLGRHHRIRGDRLAEQGKTNPAADAYRLADENFRNALKHKAPQETAIRLALAECHYNLGETLARGAGDAATRAKAAADDERATLRKEAERLEKEAGAAFDKAAGKFLAIIKAHPKQITSEDVYFWLGAWFREHGRLRPAIQTYESFVKDRRDSAKADLALYQLVELYGTLRPPDYRAVIKYADALIEECEKSKLVLRTKFAKAEALFALKKYDRAEPLYRELSREGSGEMKVASDVKLGHIHLAKKEYGEAVGRFARVGLLYKHDTFTPEALYFAGKAKVLDGAPDDVLEAIHFWQQLVKSYPASKWTARMKKDLGPLGYHVGENGTIEKE